MKKIEPGIYNDLSNEDYHGHHASYSKSSLSDFAKYPHYMIWHRQNRKRKTHFDLGTAVHSAILEPEKFESEIAIIPPDVLGKNGARSTKAYKEWAANQLENKAIVSQSDLDMVLRIRDNVLDNPAHSKARELLTGGRPEVSCFWEETFYGDNVEDDSGYHYMEFDQFRDDEEPHTIMMKCRPDYMPAAHIFTDLKTDGTAIDQESWERRAYNLHYHWSAALTLRGTSMAIGRTRKAHYVFVVVEINPPHEVAVFRATEEFIGLGMKEVMRTMGRLAWCDKHNKWPGIPNQIQQLGLPGWVYKKLHAGI